MTKLGELNANVAYINYLESVVNHLQQMTYSLKNLSELVDEEDFDKIPELTDILKSTKSSLIQVGFLQQKIAKSDDILYHEGGVLTDAGHRAALRYLGTQEVFTKQDLVKYLVFFLKVPEEAAVTTALSMMLKSNHVEFGAHGDVPSVYAFKKYLGNRFYVTSKGIAYLKDEEGIIETSDNYNNVIAFPGKLKVS